MWLFEEGPRSGGAKDVVLLHSEGPGPSKKGLEELRWRRASDWKSKKPSIIWHTTTMCFSVHESFFATA